MALEQKVLTTPTFINGSLQPAGAIVSVDMEQFVDEDGKPAPEKNVANLANIGEAPVLIPTEMAAIAPTGPKPVMPQQIPPGTMQTADGYAHGGASLVAEGVENFDERLKEAETLNEGVEEEAVARLNATAQDSGTAPGTGGVPGADTGSGTGTADADSANGTNGTETGALDEGRTFVPGQYVEGVTIGSATFDGLTAEQLRAVHEAEAKGANRTGMLDKIDDAIRALDAQ